MNKVYFEVRATVQGKRIVGQIPYNSLSLDLGGFREKLSPGCFAASLQRKDKVMSLWSHDQTQPLASTENGSLRIEDRQDALHFELTPVDTGPGRDCLELVRSGVITGCSFGFSPEDVAWEDNGKIRLIQKATLHEISPVSFPAYPETSVDVRHTTRSNTMKINTESEIREELGRLADKAEQITEKAGRENRQMTTDENNEFTDIMLSFDRQAARLADQGHTVHYFRNSGLEGVNRWLHSHPGPTMIDLSDPQTSNNNFNQTSKEYRFDPKGSDLRSAFNRYLVAGPHALNAAEMRALQADSDTGGGFLVTPLEVSKTFISGLNNLLWIRKLANLIPLTAAESLGVPDLSSDIQDPTWEGEISDADLDSSLSFAQRALTPHRLPLGIKVSRKLLRLSDLPERIVRERLTYKGNVVMENNFLNGNGSGKPLGVFTASNDGIPTSRDVSTGNTSTAITADNLIEVEGSLKEQYLSSPSLAWVFSRAAITKIRKLKDGEGNYIWSQGLSGRKNEILGIQYFRSEYCPSTFTSGSYVGILGDFKYFWICDSLKIEIQRLIEKYALSDQDAFLMNCYTDGMPVLGEAFSRVKLA